jgi:CRP-like cAMP-binding protein
MAALQGFDSNDAPFVQLHALFAPPAPNEAPLPACVAPTVAAFGEALRFALTSAPSAVVANLLMGSLERHTAQAELLRVLAERAKERPAHVALMLHCWWRSGPPVAPGEPQRLFEELRERLREGHAGSAVELLMRDCCEEEVVAVAGAAEGNAAEAAQVTPPVRESPQPESRVWQLMHPHALAAQLTGLDEEWMDGMAASDVMAGRAQTAAGRAYEAWMQRCPLWVASEIVTAAEADRSRVIVYFLKVVVQLREIRSSSSFALVMEGLRHEAVQRLSLAWESVLEVHADAWEGLVRDTLPARLHAPRRAPTVPFVGGLQRQVFQILLETQFVGATDVTVGDGSVDWAAEARIQTVCREWLRIRRRRQYMYGIVKHEATLEHLRRGAPVLTAGQLGTVSRQVQSENHTLSESVRSAGGIVSGFSSWFKNSPTAAEESKRSLQDAVCLPGSDWSELFSQGETLKFAQRAVVLEAGALNTHLWRVRRGAVSAISADGFIVGTLGEGQVFGETAMIFPLGVRVPVALVAVAPSCEVQRVTFVAVAATLKAQIQLRVSFYRALTLGMSSRRPDLDLSTVGIPPPLPAAQPEEASAKFFRRFDMKNQEVLASFDCSWEASCRLTACGKVYVTRHVVAVLGRAWCATFRWVAHLAELSLFPDGTSLRLVAGTRALVLRVAAADQIVLAVPPPPVVGGLPKLPPPDNRSWDYLVTCGMRSAELRQGEALPSDAGEAHWVARGQLVCRETGQLVPRNGSCFDGSFFALQPPPRRVVVLSETAVVLSVSWTFLHVLSAARPDVASNFFRLESATVAERLLALDPLAAAAIALTKSE